LERVAKKKAAPLKARAFGEHPPTREYYFLPFFFAAGFLAAFFFAAAIPSSFQAVPRKFAQRRLSR
jgi:hypothetical protein